MSITFLRSTKSAFLAALLSSLGWGALLAGQPALCTKLPSPQYYAVAKKNLAAETMLTPDNVSISSTTESDDMPRRAMWLTSPDEAYGFKIHLAVEKGAVITGDHLLAPGYNNPTPKPTDALWMKYAKSSVVCDKRHDFATAQRYENGALAELQKLALANKRLVYRDDEHWIFSMLNRQEEQQAKNQQATENTKKSMAELKNPLAYINVERNMKHLHELEDKISSDTQASLAKNQHLYDVLAKVLPAKCQEVAFIKEAILQDKKSLEAVTKSLAPNKP